jgi:endonuclease YncB( thermonuclease family)
MMKLMRCLLLFYLFLICISRPTRFSRTFSLNSRYSSVISKIGFLSFSVYSGYVIYRKFVHKDDTQDEVYYETVEDIPRHFFQQRRDITGFVVKVTDGDTIRIRHPGNVSFIGPLKYHTIPIRLAAVDAPQLGNGQREAQPYAEEAKQFVYSEVFERVVRVKLLAKDQYGRILGLVRYKRENEEYDLSEELLKRGLAEVYRGGGSRYDGPVNRWNELEDYAKYHRFGMWKDGINGVESPSLYRKAIKMNRELATLGKSRINYNRFSENNYSS